MKKVALSLVILGVLLNGFADEKVLTAQEQKEKAEQIKTQALSIATILQIKIMQQNPK